MQPAGLAMESVLTVILRYLIHQLRYLRRRWLQPCRRHLLLARLMRRDVLEPVQPALPALFR